MPFEIDYTPVKQIYFTIQLCGAYFVYINAGNMAWLVLETLLHLTLRIQHVKEVFVKAIEQTDAQERRKAFNCAIKYHVAVLG